jgi:hypothetical protein
MFQVESAVTEMQARTRSQTAAGGCGLIQSSGIRRKAELLIPLAILERQIAPQMPGFSQDD